MKFRGLRKAEYTIKHIGFGFGGTFTAQYGSSYHPYHVMLIVERTDPGTVFRALNFCANQIDQAMCVRFGTFEKQHERMLELLGTMINVADPADRFEAFLPDQLAEPWESDDKPDSGDDV